MIVKTSKFNWRIKSRGCAGCNPWEDIDHYILLSVKMALNARCFLVFMSMHSDGKRRGYNLFTPILKSARNTMLKYIDMCITNLICQKHNCDRPRENWPSSHLGMIVEIPL